MPALPSASLIARAADRERDAQLRHFEGLDAKAGIVVGFAGVLVAVGRTAASPLALTGLVAAAVAALLGLASFGLRRYPVLGMRGLRDRYLRSDARFTALRLLDLTIAVTEEATGLLAAKARRLTLAVLMLVSSTVLLALEALLR